MSAHLPKTESDLNSFRRKLEQSCQTLEEKLNLYGFIERDQNGDKVAFTKLTDYLSSLSSVYADFRRRETLDRARRLLIADYHNTMVAVGDAIDDDLSSAGDIGDPRALLDQSGSFAIQKLKFDTCQISLAACRLLKLIHEVLKQACSASPKVAHILFQSSRDCLELFMAVIPRRFNEVIETIPRMGAVFYNDCIYIAHNCTLISHSYRQMLGDKVDKIFYSTIGFADLNPRLRAVGEIILNSHIEREKIKLLKLVDSINLNPRYKSNPDSNEENIVNENKNTNNCESLQDKSIKKNSSQALMNDERNSSLVVHHLENLSSQWLGVLQEEMYASTLGSLLEEISAKIISTVLSICNGKEDKIVSDCAAIDMTRCFRNIQRVSSLFQSIGDVNQEDNRMTLLETVCPSWKKFLALTDLFEYSLSEVGEWLPKKKFSPFTDIEMTGLITSIFPKSQKRQEVFAAITDLS